PVHRRILFGMSELNNYSDKPHKKCARIVGEVMGKFHPHGDSSIYDALVRMSQDFSINHPLVDGHGNFGSMDGDKAAAMRYTEARLSKIADEMLRDIEKNTVNFYPNFDETLMQPSVLPSRFPNLLVNGSDGIAVGMATNIPPHNLAEIIDGVVAIIDNPSITIEELMDIVIAPDYPTGGYILGRSAIRQAYKTGRGGVIIRAKAEIEEFDNGKHYKIVINEIPYQVNKAKLIIQIANLVKDKRIEGISDIRDESDRDGVRIIIELKRDANPQIVLNNLYKLSQLQVSNGIILLCLVDGQPRVLNLQEMLYYYLQFQKEIIVRRTKYDLEKAEEREHIVEGLVIAVNNIDEVIKIIKNSDDRQSACVNLIEKFELSEKQANAILEMKLSRLTGLEIEKLKQELADLLLIIKDLKDILANPQRVNDIIKTEILEIKNKYAKPRKSEVTIDYDEIDIGDLIEQHDVVISTTQQGYIKRMPVKDYKSQNRGGVGVTTHKTKEEDTVIDLFVCNSHDDLLMFTNFGKVYGIKAYNVPEATKQAKGRALVNLLALSADEKVNAILKYKKDHEGYLLMATEHGLIKKTKMTEFENIRKTGKIAIKLVEDDILVGVKVTEGNDELLIASNNGKCMRFCETTIRTVGRTSQGVRSMRITGDEKIIDLMLVKPDSEILTVTQKGYAKRTRISDYRIQGRGGKGIKAGNFNEKTGKVVAIKPITIDKDILAITNNGITIRTHAEQISLIGRASQGVKMMRIKDDSFIVSVAVVERQDEEEIDNITEQINEETQNQE
ncbi:MAG: DNA gyrase subunit A, partial [Clostridia bacterium]|nr:DNA gyrase subunit A [Clostridia bacterium]